MTVLTRSGAVVAAVALVAGSGVAGTATPAGSVVPDPVVTTLHAAVESVPVADEVREGYDRALFPHWIDADRDGCHTRQEVLLAESVADPQIGERCVLTGGQWHSYYDHVTWDEGSRLDIDHVVALAEAWDSGARSWTTDERRSFANDLGDPRSLVAVTGAVNRSKADQDPATWLPPDPAATCRFLTEWVVVKHRWGLTVDAAEQEALLREVQTCENTAITYTPAR